MTSNTPTSIIHRYLAAHQQKRLSPFAKAELHR